MFNTFFEVLTFTTLLNWFAWWWFFSPMKSSQQKRQENTIETISKYTNFTIMGFIFVQLFGLQVFPLKWLALPFIGTIFILFGVWISVMGKLALGSNWVPGYRAVASKQLITRSVYHYIRHPIYLGIVLVYVGCEMVVGSWLFVSFLFLFIPIYFQSKKEEALLGHHFKEEYASYQRGTKMLIPYLL